MHVALIKRSSFTTVLRTSSIALLVLLALGCGKEEPSSDAIDPLASDVGASDSPQSNTEVQEPSDDPTSSGEAVGEDAEQNTTGIEANATTLPSDWKMLWKSARFGELLSHREDLLLGTEPGVAETLTLAALFASNMDLAVELRAFVPEDSPVGAYIDVFELLVKGQDDKEKTVETINQLATIIEQWEPKSEQESILKANADPFAVAAMGYRSAAFTRYSNALKTWPDNYAALRNLAVMYNGAGMYEFSVAALERLISINGNVPELRSILHRTYNQAKMDERAQSFAEATYSLNPSDPSAVIILAGLYLNSGESAAAQRLLSAAVRDVPDDPRLKILLASAQIKNGLPNEALATLDGQDVPEEMLPVVLEIRAHTRAALGEWGEVESLLERLIPESMTFGSRILLVAAHTHLNHLEESVALLPEPGTLGPPVREINDVLTVALGETVELTVDGALELAAALGESPERTGQFAHALASMGSQLNELAYESFTSLYDELPEAHYLGWCALEALARAHNFDGRVAKAEAIMARSENYWEAYLGLASVYEAEEKEAEELEALQLVVEANPERSQVIKRIARYADRIGDQSLAMDSYESLIALTPEDPMVLNNHAYYLLETNGDASRAEEGSLKALQAIPANPNILHTLGLARLRLGKLEESYPNLRDAVAMRPGDPTLSLDYGKLLMAQGKTNEGLGFVRQSLLFAAQIGVPFERKEEAIALLKANMEGADQEQT